MSAKKVLIVDDEKLILITTKLVLESGGCEVLTAGDGRTAIELAKAESPDLILLDIMMPGIDGYEVSRKLREVHGKGVVPVIFVTAKDDAQAMREGFRSGGTLFLSKPFNSSQLLRIVKSIIR